MVPGVKRASSIESNEVEAARVEASRGVLGGGGDPANNFVSANSFVSATDWSTGVPHEGHDASSAESGLAHLGQFIGRRFYCNYRGKLSKSRAGINASHVLSG